MATTKAKTQSPRIYRISFSENEERRTDTFSFRWYLGKSDIQLWQDHLCSLIVADSHVPALLITSHAHPAA